MQKIYEFTQANEEGTWQQVAADLSSDQLEYSVVLKNGGHSVFIQLDIDPGGGFEGGYAFTSFIAPVENATDFKFAIHHESLLDEVGKFLGMQDVITGYAEFDKRVIVKTNDEEQVKHVFSQAEARSVFLELSDYNMHISRHPEPQLKFEIEEGITDPEKLRRIYNSFVAVLKAINTLEANTGG